MSCNLLKRKFIIPATWLILTVACTATPILAPSAQNSPTDAGGGANVTSTLRPTDTSTITLTPTITPTATAVPDVELAQIQLIHYDVIIAEIVNHLSVPVVFEDLKPAFQFDIYDPIQDRHVEDEIQINRLGPTYIPCALFPGEHAFFLEFYLLRNWENTNSSTKPSQLQITYKSLGVPRADWTDHSTQPELRNVQWNISNHVLHFSYQHDPVTDIHNAIYTMNGSIGVYDKDDRLLGVGVGDPIRTAESGNGVGYWVSLNGTSLGDDLNMGWTFWGVDNIESRIDHISILIEIIKKDGFCFKVAHA